MEAPRRLSIRTTLARRMATPLPRQLRPARRAGGR